MNFENEFFVIGRTLVAEVHLAKRDSKCLGEAMADSIHDDHGNDRRDGHAHRGQEVHALRAGSQTVGLLGGFGTVTPRCFWIPATHASQLRSTE